MFTDLWFFFYSVGGIAFGLFVLGLITPLFIHLLVNQPGGQEKSGFHLFTYPEEGKVKLIVRGDTLVRMIMLYSGHRFARDGERSGAPYWEIIPTKGRTKNGLTYSDSKSESPLAGIHPLLKPWAWYVYMITGAVFTGIYPFQTVREQLMERTHMTRAEDSDATKNPDGTPKEPLKSNQAPSGHNFRLTVIEDYSDHFRARQFQYVFRIVSADTKDKIPLGVIGVIKAEVTNPHKTAFGTDRWEKQLVNMTTDAITNFARYNKIDSFLSAETKEDAEKLNEAILAIKEDQLLYGIEIIGVDIIDVSPILSEDDLSKLHAEALAIQVGKAIVIEGDSRAQATLLDGTSRAKVLDLLNEANNKGGAHAMETIRIEGLVRAAEAAKGGTVLLSMGGQPPVDSMNAAILAELKKINRSQEQGV